jgi:hypothetical protein
VLDPASACAGAVFGFGLGCLCWYAWPVRPRKTKADDDHAGGFCPKHGHWPRTFAACPVCNSKDIPGINAHGAVGPKGRAGTGEASLTANEPACEQACSHGQPCSCDLGGKQVGA